MSAPRHHRVTIERGGVTFSDNSRWLHDDHVDGGEVSPELVESLHSIIEQANRREPAEGK